MGQCESETNHKQNNYNVVHALSAKRPNKRRKQQRPQTPQKLSKKDRMSGQEVRSDSCSLFFSAKHVVKFGVNFGEIF